MQKYKFKWEIKKTEKEGRTDVSQEGFYDSVPWRRLRKSIIDDSPLCVMCLQEDILKPANVIDHIVPLTVDNMWELGLERDNLQPLCTKCHILKTNRSKSAKYSPENLLSGKRMQLKFNNFD